MPVLKSLGKTVGGFFFTTLLAMVIIMSVMTQTVNYGSLKSIATNVISQQLISQQNITVEQLTELHSELVERCTEDTYTHEVEGQSMTINCAELKSSKPEDLVTVIAGSTFDDFYNKEYDCEFLDCLRGEGGMEKYGVLLTPATGEFLSGIFTYIIGALVIFGTVLFVSLDGTVGKLKGFGSSLMGVGISYFIIPIIKNSTPLPNEAAPIVEPIMNQIIDPLGTKLLVIFVVGAVLFGAGFVIERRQRSETHGKSNTV